MKEEYICPICGNTTSSYMGNYRKDKLCREHAQQLKDGYIKKCDVCGKYHNENEKCKIDNNNEILKNDFNQCIICGEYAPYGPQCKECYYEMLDYKDQFDKNKKLYEFRDYYYNLKNNIYRMYDYEMIKSNCNKLFAMAQLTEDLFNTDELTSKVQNDILKILTEKRPKKDEQQEVNTHTRKSDSFKEEIFRTEDGHNVKSLGEKIIDDFLYASSITHAYSIDVSEVDTKIDRAVQCDWFIPILSTTKGIYIEYWGINNKKDYNKNKEEKIKTYEKYNLPLIAIEKDEINDTQALKSRIRRELKELSKKYYKIDKDF